jgi:branched-chain amino acid transport system substrate-binding protein
MTRVTRGKGMKTTLYILTILLLTACTHTQDTIPIGGLFGLTGISQSFGEDEMRGAQLAIEEINAAGGVHGKQLALLIEDGQTDVTANVNAYQKLVTANDVHYIIGPTWTEAAHALVPNLQSDDVILISPSAGEVEHELFNNPNFFKTYPPYRDEIPTVLEHMTQHNIHRVAVVRSDGSFENSMYRGFVDYAKQYSITIAADYKVSYSDKSFLAEMTKLKEQQVDAIYLVHGDYASIGEFFEQARAAGITQPIYTYSGAESRTSLLTNYASAVEGMLYPMSVVSEQDKTFNTRFKARYGTDPLTPVAATAYDAVKMLAIGLENGESIQAVREGMHAITDYRGASPITGFTDSGWPVTDRHYEMKTVQNSEFVRVT